MTTRKRFVTALERRVPDRLPVTTHHLMPYYLRRQLAGASENEFFARFGLDPIEWIHAHRPGPDSADFFDSNHNPRHLEARRISSPSWCVTATDVPDSQYRTTRFTFHTPKKDLTMVVQENDHTAWVLERLLTNKADLGIIGEFVTHPACDVVAVNRCSADRGDSTLIRGTIPGFDVSGQPGCWQDAAVLYGIEALILETFDDPAFVHELLRIVQARKLSFIDSLQGAEYDVLELGGGDASSTVISPKIFDEFVAPYDSELIERAHAAGQRIVYHTCGGMMPLLERLADLGADALETFTPPAMGGDVDLREAKRRIGDRVCFIGGFDQNRFFTRATPEETRAEVRRCFNEAGEGGGFILSPSDHFFDARPELLEAFAGEARKCVY